MYSDSDLDQAVQAGVLTGEQAAGFRAFVVGRPHASAVDEEQFRLLTGFNDIFVTLAVVILLSALAWIAEAVSPAPHASSLPGLAVTIGAWGLAEFFTRRRRMALPSIVLLWAFVGGAFATILAPALAIIGEWSGTDPAHGGIALGLSLALSALSALVASALHWRRFRVPITIAAGAAAISIAIIGLVLWLIGGTINNDGTAIVWLVMLGLGIGVFGFAMRWDASDPQRLTRRSDVAFWLHLLAAPMIVHPVFTLLKLNSGQASAGEGAVVLILYAAIGLVSLAIDRRALLVSALAYVLYALNGLFRDYGVIELSVALTALIIGSALLLLSAFWGAARRRVVTPLPPVLRRRLPVLDRQAV